MSYVLNWIAEAARRLKEAQLAAYTATALPPEWHTAVEAMLKPQALRSGQ